MLLSAVVLGDVVGVVAFVAVVVIVAVLVAVAVVVAAVVVAATRRPVSITVQQRQLAIGHYSALDNSKHSNR